MPAHQVPADLVAHASGALEVGPRTGDESPQRRRAERLVDDVERRDVFCLVGGDDREAGAVDRDGPTRNNTGESIRREGQGDRRGVASLFLLDGGDGGGPLDDAREDCNGRFAGSLC